MASQPALGVRLQGDQSLRPEQMLQAELGYKGRIGTFQPEVVAYVERVSDLITDGVLKQPSSPGGTTDTQTGQFIIGNTYVRPRVSSGPAVAVNFHRSQKLNFWMQVYNLAIDDKSKKNAATIQYQITDLGSNKAILDTSETSAALGDNSANSDQLTLRRSVSLASLQPGKYQVTITVNDNVSKQQVAQTAPFTVD